MWENEGDEDDSNVSSLGAWDYDRNWQLTKTEYMERKSKDEGMVGILFYFSLPPASQVLLTWGSAPLYAIFAGLLRLRLRDILPAPQWLEYDIGPHLATHLWILNLQGMTRDLLTSLELFRATETVGVQPQWVPQRGWEYGGPYHSDGGHSRLFLRHELGCGACCLA